MRFVLRVGDKLEDGDRLDATRHRHLAQGLVAEVAPGEPPGLLPHQHLTGPARLLEPGGHVEGVPDEISIALREDDLAGVHAHAQR